MRALCAMLIVLLFVLPACQVQQAWVWKDGSGGKNVARGVRVGIAPPAFLARQTSAWEPVLAEVVQKHPGLVHLEKNADWYLWASVDVGSGGSFLNLSVRDARGRLVAVMTRESSDFADRQTGRALPEGAVAMVQALGMMVREVFPEAQGATNQGGEAGR